MKFVALKNFINKALVFYFPGQANYWHTITPCKIQIDSKEDISYYLDFSSKHDFRGEMNSEGIPLYHHHTQGNFYHPIVICQYALGLFEILQLSDYKNDDVKSKFIKQADWLVNNSVNYSGGLIWEINYDIEDYGIHLPWYSAMAQGEAISVLVRAYHLDEREEYVETAQKALIPFTINVTKGGLINYFNDQLIYEEYPSPLHTVGVLNGFIFSLFGLYDLKKFFDDKSANQLFRQGIDSLKKLLPYYDLGYWTQYYLFDHPDTYPASFTYHMLVVEQLKALAVISGEKVFDKYSKKWLNYSKNYINRTRALLKKLFYARKLN